MAGLITASQFASAQNPNSISQSDKLDSNSHTTIQSSLDGTIVEPGRHGTTENSKDLQAHMVFSAEALTGFITPNWELASDGWVTSLEADLYVQKGDISIHAMVHDISPNNADDKLDRELATSLTGKYDHNPYHLAFGLRHYDHTWIHADLHEHDDGHWHKKIETVQKLVREQYLALLLQAGVDIGEHFTFLAGTEYDLGISKDKGQDETHLTFAGVDVHTHWLDCHIAARLLAVHSHGNKNEPDSTFIRPSVHIERKIMEKLYVTLFAEFVAGQNRESAFVWGIGGRVKF